MATACGGGGGSGDASGPQVSTLSVLEFTGVTLSPAFSPQILNYTGEAAATTDLATFSATSAGAQASVTFDGEVLGSGSVAKVVMLDYGDNTFEIEVTSGDGTTTSTYTITITRAVGPRLTEISLSAGTLSPAFDPDVTDYDVAVGGLIQAITITPTTPSTASLITVAGATVQTGQPSAPLELALGQTSLVVRVVAPAGEQRDYTITVTREFVQEARLDDPGFGTTNGIRVAIDGDTAVLGKAGLDNRAEVYVRDGAGWSLQQTLTPSMGGSADEFGCDVAIDGDTIVVGARFMLGNGAVVVFRRTGATWVEQVVLQATAPSFISQFGTSVALDDGTLVAGCDPEELAFVFVDDGTTWVQRAIVTGTNTEPGDRFASTAGSIALHAGTLVIGASEEDSASIGVNSTPNENAPGSGAVYVFTGSGSNWQQQAYLKASNAGSFDRFGRSVDLDGDTLVVGAPNESSSSDGVNSAPDDTAPNSGAAYVFVRNGGVWTQQAYVKSFNSDSNHEFGAAVSVDGDALVIGAPGEQTSGTGINPAPNSMGIYGGAAYVFSRSGTAWSQIAFVKPDVQNIASSMFGRAVSVDGARFVVAAERPVYLFR